MSIKDLVSSHNQVHYQHEEAARTLERTREHLESRVGRKCARLLIRGNADDFYTEFPLNREMIRVLQELQGLHDFRFLQIANRAMENPSANSQQKKKALFVMLSYNSRSVLAAAREMTDDERAEVLSFFPPAHVNNYANTLGDENKLEAIRLLKVVPEFGEGFFETCAYKVLDELAPLYPQAASEILRRANRNNVPENQSPEDYYPLVALHVPKKEAEDFFEGRPLSDPAVRNAVFLLAPRSARAQKWLADMGLRNVQDDEFLLDAVPLLEGKERFGTACKIQPATQITREKSMRILETTDFSDPYSFAAFHLLLPRMDVAKFISPKLRAIGIREPLSKTDLQRASGGAFLSLHRSSDAYAELSALDQHGDFQRLERLESDLPYLRGLKGPEMIKQLERVCGDCIYTPDAMEKVGSARQSSDDLGLSTWRQLHNMLARYVANVPIALAEHAFCFVRSGDSRTFRGQTIGAGRIRPNDGYIFVVKALFAGTDDKAIADAYGNFSPEERIAIRELGLKYGVIGTYMQNTAIVQGARPLMVNLDSFSALFGEDEEIMDLLLFAPVGLDALRHSHIESAADERTRARRSFIAAAIGGITIKGSNPQMAALNFDDEDREWIVGMAAGAIRLMLSYREKQFMYGSQGSTTYSFVDFSDLINVKAYNNAVGEFAKKVHSVLSNNGLLDGRSSSEFRTLVAEIAAERLKSIPENQHNEAGSWVKLAGEVGAVGQAFRAVATHLPNREAFHALVKAEGKYELFAYASDWENCRATCAQRAGELIGELSEEDRAWLSDEMIDPGILYGGADLGSFSREFGIPDEEKIASAVRTFYGKDTARFVRAVGCYGLVGTFENEIAEIASSQMQNESGRKAYDLLFNSDGKYRVLAFALNRQAFYERAGGKIRLSLLRRAYHPQAFSVTPPEQDFLFEGLDERARVRTYVRREWEKLNGDERGWVTKEIGKTIGRNSGDLLLFVSEFGLVGEIEDAIVAYLEDKRFSFPSNINALLSSLYGWGGKYALIAHVFDMLYLDENRIDTQRIWRGISIKDQEWVCGHVARFSLGKESLLRESAVKFASDLGIRNRILDAAALLQGKEE